MLPAFSRLHRCASAACCVRKSGEVPFSILPGQKPSSCQAGKGGTSPEVRVSLQLLRRERAECRHKNAKFCSCFARLLK